MKRSTVWAFASLLIATMAASGACLAADNQVPTGSAASVLGALAGAAVPSAELGKERARGLGLNLNGSSVASGTVAGNAAIASPVSGFIDNEHSIANTAGITTVLQNLGNNSVLQVSTTINITAH